MKRSSRNHTKGYLLIEAMVAMGVLTTGVFGIFALMSQSIKLTRVIDDQYVGTYLAAEGIEVVKNLLDSNFLTDPGNWNAKGFSAPACYEVDHQTVQLDAAPLASGASLLFDGVTYRYGGGGTATPFSRSVCVSPIGAVGVSVVSTVEWASGDSSVTLEDKFYAWHEGAGPAGPPIVLPPVSNKPSVSTIDASSVTNNSAVLNGSANPNGLNTNALFRYEREVFGSPSLCSDTTGWWAPGPGPATKISIGGGAADSPFSWTLNGLASGETYWYCAVAENADGKSGGGLKSFVTP